MWGGGGGGGRISIESFQNQFKNLSSQNEDQPHPELEQFISSFNLTDNSATFEELDSRISQTEISRACKQLNTRACKQLNTRACKQLNTNKPPSMDNILYEYLTESIDLTVSSFEIFFNYILETGDFLKNWSKGLIISVFKNGDQSDPSNFRGIALISCFAKLFIVILNNRLKEWADNDSVLTDAHYGFRSGLGTVD